MMEKGETDVKGEGAPSPMMEVPQAGMIAISQGLSMTSGDTWFNQLLVFQPTNFQGLIIICGHGMFKPYSDQEILKTIWKNSNYNLPEEKEKSE